MNNNLYQWHDEQMVRHEIQELNHAVTRDRFLREAGLTTLNLLTRVAPVLGKISPVAKRTEETKPLRRAAALLTR